MQNIETLRTICIYLYEFKLKNLNWNQNSEIETMLNFFANVSFLREYLDTRKMFSIKVEYDTINM